MIRWNRYIRVIGTVVVSSLLLLAGCKNDISSAEDLFETMQNKLSDVTSFSADASLKLDMDYSLGDANDNMLLLFQENITALIKSNEVYSEGSMSVTDVYDEEWKSYIVNDGGKYASYSYIEDQWYYNDVDEESIEQGPSSVFEVVSEVQGYSFENNGDYVVKAKIDSDNLVSILNCFYSNVIESAFSEGLDTADMTGTLVLTADKNTCLPKKLEILFDDCSEMFTGEDMFDTVNINEFVFSVEFNDYDKTDSIEVPADVADMFEEPEGDGIYEGLEDETYDAGDEHIEDEVSADDEGSYELTDYQGKKSIKIKAPEGYAINADSDAAMISFDKTEVLAGGYCTAAYELAELSDEFTKEDVEGYIGTLYDFYGTDEAYKDMELITKQSIEKDNITINYSGMKYYYEGDDIDKGGYSIKYCYWVYIDDYVIICNVTDYAEDGFDNFNAEETAELLFENIIV